MPDTDRAHDEAHDKAHDDHVDAGYCADPGGAAPAGAVSVGPAGGPPYADCVLCGKPTEYPADRPGMVLCPVCEWQEAQRSACSG
ncbi:hypothetical protein [Streptomyces sp. NPDC101150]|uniref:hypothetical protein n=1 Tax=Streptomyces sp. NPDC101150 TaxID=3366114 RepID=UPI0038007BCB